MFDGDIEEMVVNWRKRVERMDESWMMDRQVLAVFGGFMVFGDGDLVDLF
jgi:hypothetical protein